VPRYFFSSSGQSVFIGSHGSSELTSQSSNKNVLNVEIEIEMFNPYWQISGKPFCWKTHPRQFKHWWISDLIPKKSEKFEFRKNFFIIFFSVEN